MRVGNRAILTEVINTWNILSCKPKENYPLDVDAIRKVILKDIIIVFGAKIFERQIANKNFKISFGFFSLQGNPALLVPWMVYNIVFMIAITILYIMMATKSLAAGVTVYGAVYIIATVLYVGK